MVSATTVAVTDTACQLMNFVCLISRVQSIGHPADTAAEKAPEVEFDVMAT